MVMGEGEKPARGRAKPSPNPRVAAARPLPNGHLPLPAVGGEGEQVIWGNQVPPTHVLPLSRRRGRGGWGVRAVPTLPAARCGCRFRTETSPCQPAGGGGGWGGAGVPGGPPRVARAASNPTSRLVRLGEGAVARRPEPGRSDRTDRQTQGETPRIVLRHRMIYDVPLHHRRAGGPGPAATGRDPRRRHDGTGGEAARGARVSRHRDRACRHGTTPVVNRRLAGTEGHQSMSAQHLDQPTRIAGARTRRDSPRLAAMAIAGDVAEPRAHRQACRLVRNPANTSSPA